jgi:hypothetical protein
MHPTCDQAGAKADCTKDNKRHREMPLLQTVQKRQKDHEKGSYPKPIVEPTPQLSSLPGILVSFFFDHFLSSGRLSPGSGDSP